jgi:Mrp family chromosome partitioning ATPase
MSLLASYRASSGENAVAVRSFSDGEDTNDEFRLIKWHFLARSAASDVAGRSPRVLLITSAVAGEGKSYVAHHLAANFALDPHVQLTLDQSRIVKSTGLGNVRAILAGGARSNAPELLSDTRLDHLLASLTADQNSFVIVDGGPILRNSGAAVVARIAGQVGFVVASNRTSRSQINKALGTLDRIAGPIDDKTLGLIFN